MRGIVDRVDVDAQGHAVVRDYKSGGTRPSTRARAGARPPAPGRAVHARRARAARPAASRRLLPAPRRRRSAPAWRRSWRAPAWAARRSPTTAATRRSSTSCSRTRGCARWRSQSGSRPESSTHARRPAHATGAATRDLPCLTLLMAARAFTDEQLVAIERRDGDLLLDAGAGSGKTSVLVERFVRSVLEDGVEVGAILTITFTEKAAAEMRDRIRRRLRELGPTLPIADEAARATEGAFISTIHGFCARVLRSHALTAGLDPAFVVLDAPEAERLADPAFDAALEELGRGAPGAIDLIAAYGAGGLRSDGSPGPRRAALAWGAPSAVAGAGSPPDLEAARADLLAAAAAAASELGAIAEPGAKVLEALARLERCCRTSRPPRSAVARRPLWRGTARRQRGGARDRGLRAILRDAGRVPRVCERRRAARRTDLLDRLLLQFGERSARAKREVSGSTSGPRTRVPRAASPTCGATPALPGPLCPDHGRQAPGHRPRPARADRADPHKKPVHGRRRPTVDLRLRHADVGCSARGGRLAATGARATLETTSARAPRCLTVINAVSSRRSGGRSVRSGPDGRRRRHRSEQAGGAARGRQGSGWAIEGLGAPWRVARARALSARVEGLLATGTAAGDVVLLTRATTDLRVYERTLEDEESPRT